MIILAIEALSILVLAMILSTLIVDERKHRHREMRLVKLKGYWNGSDRRSTERLNVSLEVKYYANGFTSEATSVDISAKGIRLLLDERIEAGTHLRLEIKLPGESHLLRTAGAVVWTKESSEDEKASTKRLFNTGIELSGFQNSDGKKLFDFIHSLMR